MAGHLEMSELKAIVISTVLIALNVLLMGVFAPTPLAKVVSIVFAAPIVGILVYGAVLSIGNYLAEKGIEKENMGQAVAGVGVLQLAYASFGAGILAMFSSSIWVPALAITAVVTSIIAVVAGVVVYWTDWDFSSWNWYALGFFIGVIVFGAIGTLWTPALLLAFLCGLLGFIVYLVHEIWDMRSHPDKTYLNAVGIYVAYMGVFIHILQIVLRLLSKKE